MKKICFFLVAIVFVLGSYGFSEARKYKVVCTYSVEGSNVFVNFMSIRGARAENLGKEGEKGSFPVFVRIKKKDGKIKKFSGNAKYTIKKKRIRFTAWGNISFVKIGTGTEAIEKFKKIFGDDPDTQCYAESADIDILASSSSTSVTVSSSNKTPVSSGSGNKLLQSIKKQLDRIEKKLAFIGIK